MQVFLVEDSPIIRARLIELVGEVPGARVVGHASGADQAIHDILEGMPEVVVLDINLAQGSGFDVLRAVHARAPGIGFYVLSNFAAEPYRRLATELGASAFFDKTNEFARVRDAIVQRAAAAQ